MVVNVFYKLIYMKRQFQRGFTLIELLVVTAISLILLSGGIAAFSNFSDRRSVTNATEELKTYFQQAQNKANSGDLGGCTQLSGYRLITYVVGNNTQGSVQAVCSSGTASGAQTFELPAGVVVNPDLDLTFQVLNAGVQLPGNAASQEITLTHNNDIYAFTIYREGRFSEGAWQ